MPCNLVDFGFHFPHSCKYFLSLSLFFLATKSAWKLTMFCLFLHFRQLCKVSPVQMMKSESLYESQGGPIILSQAPVDFLFWCFLWRLGVASFNLPYFLFENVEMVLWIKGKWYPVTRASAVRVESWDFSGYRLRTSMGQKVRHLDNQAMLIWLGLRTWLSD